ncbi:hypothetical protein ABMA57_00920 [Saccharospirillum sp. HFRX-1]|uniref:hypothetical protein n=1 Tax=unclassified Saccharospirillum TaxID=2633430 RepID=UPI00371C6769
MPNQQEAVDAQPEVTATDAAEVDAIPGETLAEEIQLLEDVQAGLALALAACEEEAHCVTALNEQEMQHMRDDLSELMADRELAVDDPLRERYQALLDEQTQLQQTVAQVTANIDRDALDGAWSDQFEIDEIVVGPQVPFPNADITLSRFEDLNQPLPIE